MRIRQPLVIYVFADSLIAVAIAVFTVVWANELRMPPGTISDYLALRITLLNALFALGFAVTWRECSAALGLYHRHLGGFLGPALRVVAASGIMAFILALYLLLRRSSGPTLTIVLAFFALSCAYQFLRILSASGIRSGHSQFERVLILGSGRRAMKAWKELRTRYYRHKRLIGFVDDRPHAELPVEVAAHYACHVDHFADYLVRNVIDEVIVAVPMRSCYDMAQRAVSIAEAAGVRVVTLNDTYGLLYSKNLRSRAPLFVELAPKDEPLMVAEALKRLMDVIIASIAVILTAPLCLVIAIAIKVTSPGPVLFIQDRYGYRRRLFPMYKFRSMVANAPELMASLESRNEATGPIFKIREDPRITPLGRLLRRTSLDELPQLWNVLKGDMSLVGPRPMSVRDVSKFNEAQLMRRFSVRPGITGIWQVSGRSALTFEQWMSLDFAYLDQWSLGLDLRILARTLPAVLKRSGAV